MDGVVVYSIRDKNMYEVVLLGQNINNFFSGICSRNSQ